MSKGKGKGTRELTVRQRTMQRYKLSHSEVRALQTALSIHSRQPFFPLPLWTLTIDVLSALVHFRS